jgi:ACT domain-containing protein
MLKKMNVTVEIIVEEDICESDIRENIDNLNYLSEKGVKFVDCEMVGWD